MGEWMILIRAATASDQPAITALVRAARINPANLRWPNFIVAEELGVPGGRLVGVGQLRPHRNGMHGDTLLELASLAVAPAYQGRGVGRLLVECLVTRAGDRPLYLMCMNDLEPYYRRLGFAAVEGAGVPQALAFFYWMGRIASVLATAVLHRPMRLVIMRKR
jgi:N-acetylglutamate synthase-like GNAT family acetyltransferase